MKINTKLITYKIISEHKSRLSFKRFNIIEEEIR